MKCLLSQTLRPQSTGKCGSPQATKPFCGDRKAPLSPAQGRSSKAPGPWQSVGGVPPSALHTPVRTPGSPAAADHRGLSVFPQRRPQCRAAHRRAAHCAPAGSGSASQSLLCVISVLESSAHRVCVDRAQGRPLTAKQGSAQCSPCPFLEPGGHHQPGHSPCSGHRAPGSRPAEPV